MAAKTTKKKTRRRASGEGSVTRLKTGLYVGRIDAGEDPSTGKRRRIQVTSMDFDTFMTKFEEAKREFKDFGYTADRQMNLTRWTEQWLSQIADHQLKPKTYSTYASLIRKHVQPAIGSKRLVELTAADIRKVRERIVGAGLSTSTARQTYIVLSKCMEDARREKLVTENVCTRVDAPPKAASSRGAFTVEQTRALLLKAAEIPNGSRYIAALLMGIRQSEALGLTIDALDLTTDHAEIAWQLQEMQGRHGCGARGATGIYPCGYRQGTRCPSMTWRVEDGAEYRMLQNRLGLVRPKSKSGYRQVPMIAPVSAAIRQHLLDTAAAPNPYGLVWRSTDGSPIDHKTDQEGWKDLVESVGLPRTCTTHWARHSVATLLKLAGVDTMVIGEIVGHGAAAVTEGYIHISSAQAHDAMGKLDLMLAP